MEMGLVISRRMRNVVSFWEKSFGPTTFSFQEKKNKKEKKTKAQEMTKRNTTSS